MGLKVEVSARNRTRGPQCSVVFSSSIATHVPGKVYTVRSLVGQRLLVRSRMLRMQDMEIKTVKAGDLVAPLLPRLTMTR
jgi:hypothetical protein